MKAFAFCTLTACGLFLGVTTSFAQVISIGSESVSAGDQASVALTISGLGNGTALGGFDLNVAYAPGTLSFVSANYGDPGLGDQLNLEGFGTFSNTIPGTGTVDLAELSFDSPAALLGTQASQFTLATLTFDTLSPGASPLLLSLNSVADQQGDVLSPSLQNGSITVAKRIAAAPEVDSASAICALTLLLGGLAVMRGASRREEREIA